jgi:phage baseplate assembly protein W
MHLDHPFHIDGLERTAATSETGHIRDMIELILFTAPGERVMRPDFGAGVHQLIFAPLGPETAAAAQFLVEGALQQYLGDRIAVRTVTAGAEDAALTIRISYRILRTGEEVTEDFTRGAAA